MEYKCLYSSKPINGCICVPLSRIPCFLVLCLLFSPCGKNHRRSYPACCFIMFWMDAHMRVRYDESVHITKLVIL